MIHMLEDQQQEEAPAGDLHADAQEILNKIEEFQTNNSRSLTDFNTFYQQYRAQPTKQRRENMSNTFNPEMFVETEAIATAVDEMIHVDSSREEFFDIVGEDGGEHDRILAMVSKAAISKQLDMSKFRSKTLPFWRMVCLLGTYPAAVDWQLRYKTYWDGISRMRKPAYDCWTFEPFPIVNFAFDDTVASLEEREWACRTMHVRPSAAWGMVRAGIWPADVVRKALARGLDRNQYEKTQRSIAGYSEGQGKGFTAHEYYGTFESREDGEMYRAVVTADGDFLVEPEINPHDHGEKPWLECEWFTIPGEPFGMGLGHINSRTQSEINDRRNFINDMLYASLYSMWIISTNSGLKMPGNKMRWSPHEILMADQITDEHIRALRPDLAPLNAAINLEGQDVEKMRRHSGATSTLQAVATGITATEAQAIQSEATRRVKAMVRSQVATFLRDLVVRVHQLNLQFLDRGIWARVTGSNGRDIPGLVTREDLLMNADIRVRVATDLDFRPFKRREIIELLNVIAQLGKSGIISASGRRVVPDAALDELASLYGMDPRKFYGRAGLMEMETQRQMQNPATMRRAAGQMIDESPAASRVREDLAAQL